MMVSIKLLLINYDSFESQNTAPLLFLDTDLKESVEFYRLYLHEMISYRIVVAKNLVHKSTFFCPYFKCH